MVTRMAVDPVCKMTVDESSPAAISEYDGKTYYFCAQGCKIAFDQEPEKYLAQEGKPSLLSRLNPFGKR